VLESAGVVARIWHGAVPVSKSDEYLELMRCVAIEDYTRVPGNRGAFVLHRPAGDVVHFITLTFWESREAIRAFAGDDIEAAKYYEFDSHFLLECEPRVQHYDVFGDRLASS
jgi:heme-degrading monooxygenase HmoA